MKARSSEDKRKWRSEVKALRRELKQREEVRNYYHLDRPIFALFISHAVVHV